MMLKYIFIFCLVIQGVFLPELFSQKENNIWIMGTQHSNFDTTWLDTGEYKNFGANILDFNQTPVTITRYRNSLSTSFTVVNMCDKNGNLLFYSNGCKLFNGKHRLVENGDSINYSAHWANNGDDTGYYSAYVNDYYSQSMLTIRSPSNSNQYYLIYSHLKWDTSSVKNGSPFNKILYSLVDMSLNNGLGKVLVKDRELKQGNFAWNISACKKANGVDWWLLVRSMDNTNCFTALSIDSSGIKTLPNFQCIGYKLDYDSIIKSDSFSGNTGSNFSHNGKYFAFMSNRGVELFEFNRCTGLLFNPRYHGYPLNDTNYSQRDNAHINQPIFSPNNNFLYVQFQNRIYQYDVTVSDFKTSQVRIGTYDGFYWKPNQSDTSKDGFRSYFFTNALAPNGKIYIGNPNTIPFLHVIENPNSKGSLCSFKQHAVSLKTIAGGVPYYPNYSLTKDSSSCWGVGIAEINNSFIVRMYPVPTNKTLYVELPPNVVNFSNGYNVPQITVVNQLGQSMPMEFEMEKERVKINTSSLPQGIYILNIELNGNTERIVKKIVVEH